MYYNAHEIMFFLRKFFIGLDQAQLCSAHLCVFCGLCGEPLTWVSFVTSVVESRFYRLRSRTVGMGGQDLASPSNKYLAVS